MASSYSSTLRLQEPATGDQNNTWGVTLNTNFDLIDAAVNGYQTIDLTGLTAYTLTANQGIADQARLPVYHFIGTIPSPGTCIVTIPAVQKVGWVLNACAGSPGNVVLTTGGGTNAVANPSASMQILLCDGTNTSVPSFYSTITGQLNVTKDLQSQINFQEFDGVILQQGATSTSAAALVTNLTNNASIHALFQVGSSTTGSIVPSGGGTAFNTSSDYRLKTTYGPADTGAIIDAIPVYDAAYTDHPDSRRPMLLAHELQAVVPSAVHGEKDGEKTQMVDYMALIPMLIGEIQSLRKRVSALGG